MLKEGGYTKDYSTNNISNLTLYIMIIMVFSSMVFLSVFLPITFLLYLLIPTLKFKNYFLIGVSLIFYAYGEPIYVFLMIGSSFMNYLFGKAIYANREYAKRWVAISVICNIVILGTFKYVPFFVMTVNSIFGISVLVPDITLPIGISFFTFQAMSYVIDVYREPEMKQGKFSNVLLYISFFPQLIAGPIIKYYEIQKEIDNRQFRWDKASLGIRRFIAGLTKKVLISNTLAYVADQTFGLQSGGGA